jgi:hypothetical protein
MSNSEGEITPQKVILLTRDQPIGLSGVYLPLLQDGDGNLRTAVYASGGNPIEGDIPADSLTAGFGLNIVGFNELFNGVSWDRQRANTEGTVLASAARVASVDSADFTNYNARGLHCIINVSALAATPSIVPTIQGKDPISGTYYNILAGLPITTTGINIIKVYPGISAVVNASASDILPRTWRVAMTHADADSITYSVGFALIL